VTMVATGTAVVESGLPPRLPWRPRPRPRPDGRPRRRLLDPFAASHGCHDACGGGGGWEKMRVWEEMAATGMLKRDIGCRCEGRNADFICHSLACYLLLLFLVHLTYHGTIPTMELTS
jgi:hypothetical protein